MRRPSDLDREIGHILGYRGLVLRHYDGLHAGFLTPTEMEAFKTLYARRGESGLVETPEGWGVPEGVTLTQFSDCPCYSSTWHGFGLLAEECERRGLDWLEMASRRQDAKEARLALALACRDEFKTEGGVE